MTMNAIQYLFLLTDKLFPAKTPSSERKQMTKDIKFLFPDIPSPDAIWVLDTPSKCDFVAGAQIIIASISFAEQYAGEPYYSALTRRLEDSGFSLFNLYDVRWRRGRIHTARALYISRSLRDAFIKKIQV